MLKRSLMSAAGITACVSSPQRSRRYASSACRSPKRSGGTGLADLPRRALTIVLGIEAFREPEVSLAACGEPNLAADPRHAERLDPVVVEVEPDDVPLAAVKEQRVRIERALALLVAHDRPVVELQRPALRDRAFELGQPSRKLGRVARIVELHRACRLGRGAVETRSAEREVLEGEAKRLRVGELALEQVEARLERRQLLVGQLERRQEVPLRAQAV